MDPQLLFGLLMFGTFPMMIVAVFRPDLVLPASWKPTKPKGVLFYFGLFWALGLTSAGVEKLLMINPAYAKAVQERKADRVKRDEEDAEARLKKAEADAEAQAKKEWAHRERETAQRWTSRDNKIMATIMSEKFVTKLLKAPASAKFPSSSEYQVVHEGEGVYRVAGYVDSQNSFGAMLRTSFVCKVRDMGGDQWKLLDIQTE